MFGRLYAATFAISSLTFHHQNAKISETKKTTKAKGSSYHLSFL
jgi:hypothetical protein